MPVLRVQSPASPFPHPQDPQTITVTGRVYKFAPGGTLDALEADAAWLVANVAGWTLVGPVAEADALGWVVNYLPKGA